MWEVQPNGDLNYCTNILAPHRWQPIPEILGMIETKAIYVVMPPDNLVAFVSQGELDCRKMNHFNSVVIPCYKIMMVLKSDFEAYFI